VLKRSKLLSPVFLALWACTSEPVKVGENTVEKPLENATGVRTEDVAAAEKKTRSSLPGSQPGMEDVKESENRPTLSLDEIYALAVKHTERLAIRQESVIQAEADKNRAIGSWIPSLAYRNLNANTIPNNSTKIREAQQKQTAEAILLNQPRLAPGASGSVSFPPNFSNGSSLVLHVPIFTGLNEYAGISAAGPLVRQRQSELFHDAGRFYLAVAQSYFTVLQFESAVKSQEEILRVSNQNILQLERFVNLGRSRRTDLTSARANLAQTEAALQATRDNLLSNREGLATLTGTNPGLALKPDLDLPEPSVKREQAEAIADSRADVDAARSNLEVAKAALTQAWGGNLPSVFLDGYYGLPGKGIYKNEIYAQLTFQFPIFSGGTVMAGIKKAESEKRQAQLGYDQTRKQAILEIRQAHDAWTTSQAEVSAYKRALDAAKLNYAFQSDYFAKRLVTILDLLTSLTSLAQAQDNYDRAVLQTKLNRVWLGVAVGELPRRESARTTTKSNQEK